MKNLAPNITRKRLLIEGFFGVDVNEDVIRDYFETLSSDLNLRMYGEPIIFSPGGEGKEENQGYDAFVPLIDSGISLYVWASSRFLSCVIYTCKSFDVDTAVKSTSEFFQMSEFESAAF